MESLAREKMANYEAGPANLLDLEARILEILRNSNLGLSARELGASLRRQHAPVEDYQVTRRLRKMLHEDRVEFRRGRWWDRGVTRGETSGLLVAPVQPPPVSPELDYVLRGSAGARREKPSLEEGRATAEMPPAETPSREGPWGTFRSLVTYYRQCVRNEEGADASAFLNQLGERFLYLQKTGLWYPRPGLRWRASLPLGPHMAAFLNALDSTRNAQPLVLGYPLQGVYIPKDGEPDIALVRPIFYFSLEHVVSMGDLIISTEDPRPEVNLGWLEHAFSKNPQRQRSFLSACGFINRSQTNDEAFGLERGERIPSLDNLVSALTAFIPERVNEPLQLGAIPDFPLTGPFKTAIFNRAVLMLAKRTRYNETLLRELAAIERAPDAELDRTALRYVFLRGNEGAEFTAGEQTVHEELVADTNPLNAEQRRGVASLLTKEITVVTGPPGTGKSQVVSSTVANARLLGQSVLFASRNHKAIDAVVERLTDENERSLIIRTNSKDDPNLNYRFENAIKDLLTVPSDPAAKERLERLREEIHTLLEERGQTARAAYLIESQGLKLGEIEEQLAYLGRDLPLETVKFLDKNPGSFPVGSVRRVIKAAQAYQLADERKKLKGRIAGFLSAVGLIPWCLHARQRLKRIPQLSGLPRFCKPKALKGIAGEISRTLERASRFAELRLGCQPLEGRLKELPAIEELTFAMSDFSTRLAEISPRAVSLDLDSRLGLPEDADREKLSGLQAALRAMRTGLADGQIQQNTLTVLTERVPMLLKHFPCWAVTNLSAGSRIPLIAGMFDLAIVDEASQSDIPSAIPILFRAKRAGVVGDPFQLTHSSKLSTAKDTLLRRSAGLQRVEDVRYAYTESSLYDLFASSNKARPIFLSETYRSAEDIADYSNRTFYGNRLRVATDHGKLRIPKGMKIGIHWTEVNGEIKAGGGSGSYCTEEVDCIVSLVRTMLVDNNFQGTLGVVTPFRQQANRLQDELYGGDIPFSALDHARVHVDTAHGFQGDERDVILLSLCAGPDMVRGSRFFLQDTGNLLNVAVSRARAVLHVVGNREWAKSCGIRHIVNLAITRESSAREPKRGPWHPHESPWEKILYDALLKVELDPIPQLPVSSRRLDLALIRKGRNPAKIDIEVDGDCHRNPDGSRKSDDVWRDIQLQGMGWKVMRFWVYKLREDLDGCVEKVLNVWRANEQQRP